MPRFDGTGPAGMGPMTGGGRGFCSPWGIGVANRPYGITPGFGYGYGRGYGFARGFGFAPYAPSMTKEQELDFLKNQAQAMKSQLDQIETRIQQLGSDT